MPTAAIESAQGKSKRGGAPDEWEMDHALSTLRSAHKLVSDKKMMGHLKHHADKRAGEAKAMASHAGKLAKMGRISPRAMASLGKK